MRTPALAFPLNTRSEHDMASHVQAEASGAEEEAPEKLFSTVEFTEDDEVVHSPGSVFGAAALVAGTTVGAGILAVPFVTADAGFVAASEAMTGKHMPNMFLLLRQT